jgi:hypothetical protein
MSAQVRCSDSGLNFQRTRKAIAGLRDDSASHANDQRLDRKHPNAISKRGSPSFAQCPKRQVRNGKLSGGVIDLFRPRMRKNFEECLLFDSYAGHPWIVR